MPLQIRTTWAKIGMETTPGSLSIRQPRRVVTMEQTNARMMVEKEPIRVEINQYPCFAETGLKNFIDLTRENAGLGRQAFLEGVARRAQEGDRLARIENGFTAIADIAFDNMGSDSTFNIAFIPQSRPEINVAGGMEIHWQLGGVKMDYQPVQPEIRYSPGNIRFYMQRYGSLEIHYIDEKI